MLPKEKVTMRYHRMPIEVESPEELGYSSIRYNLAESSIWDARLKDLGADLNDLVLCYGEHRGDTLLRESIASQYGVAACDVLVAPGAAAGLFLVNTALLGLQSSIVVVRPNYATNIAVPRLLPCSVVCLDLSFATRFELDLGKLESLITPNTRLISVTYPHNPTGVVITEGELCELIRIAERHGCYLLVDETYRDLHRRGAPPLAAAMSDLAVSVSSLSKAFGMPGIRIGWIVCRNPDLQSLFLAAKEQVFLCGSVVDEAIALHVLRSRERLLPKISAQVKQNLDVVARWMHEQDLLEWIPPAGGVVCLPRVKEEVSIDMKEFYDSLLAQHSTYVGPGHWFEMSDRCFRLGFGWEPIDKLKVGLQNIAQALQSAVQT
jgi:aspartate/methionine/tyrosine aminotransferase